MNMGYLKIDDVWNSYMNMTYDHVRDRVDSSMVRNSNGLVIALKYALLTIY